MLPVAADSSQPEGEGRDSLLPAGRRLEFFLGLALAALCLGIVLDAGITAASAGREVSTSLEAEICGPIMGDVTWTTDQSPVNVTCDTQLRPGFTLEIEPGVEVRFTPGTSLTISGTLRAIGLPSLPITFTSGLEEPAPGSWNGLHFVAGSSDSSLAWCVVEYATAGVRIYAGPGDTVSPLFSDCVVRYHSEHGFQLEGYASGCEPAQAQPTIAGCVVEHNGGSGIHGYGHGDLYNVCGPGPVAGGIGGTVSGSTIRDNQGPGICMLSDLERYSLGDVSTAIEANAIAGNSGHGVHLDGDGPVGPRIENNLIYGNLGAGFQSDAYHHTTDLYVVNNTVHGNGGHGLAFNKSALLARLTNNVVSANGGNGLICLSSEVPQASHNDLWFNVGGDYSGCAPGPTDISANPLLLDPSAGDFHLGFGSPCIDAGTGTDAPATDFEGIVRPQGGGVDIGAHEHGRWRLFLPVTMRE